MQSKFYRELKKTHYNPKERSQFVKDIKELVDVFGYLLNYLSEKNIKVTKSSYLASILVNKYILHCLTILRLISGTELKSKLLNSKRTVYDIGSIVILTRSAIENYLTFFYLFIQPLTKEDEEFRINLYELSGLHSRQWLNPIEPEQINTKKIDEARINELENTLFIDPKFIKLDKESKNNIRGRKQARLFSWWKLLEQADLNENVFKPAWKLYSNYAHSEFISQMQLAGFFTDIEAAKDKCDTVLNIMFCLTSVFVKDFTEFFPETKERYNSLSEETLEVIDFFNGVGRKELPAEEES